MRKLQFVACMFLALLIASTAGRGGGATALAAEPATATIQELTTFGGGHEPPVGTFFASGIPGCTGGSFSDQLVSFNPSGARVVIDRTYVCLEGASLTARVALHLGTINDAGLQTADGSWRIVSVTGSVAGLTGAGSTSGLNSGCSPAGTALGMCSSGVSTVTTSIH